MADRAAIVTGASSGIGLAIAHMLGEEGYGADRRRAAARRSSRRRPRGCARRATRSRSSPATSPTRTRSSRSSPPTASASAASTCSSTTPASASARRSPSIQTKQLDMQLDINLRSIVLFYRECDRMLRAAGAEHRNALVVNTASISGKRGEAWLSVYSATKHGVVGWTEAMNKELGGEGIKSTALCPAFVDTPMTDFVKGQVAAEEMIRPEDIAEAVRLLLSSPPACVVPEILFIRPGRTSVVDAQAARRRARASSSARSARAARASRSQPERRAGGPRAHGARGRAPGARRSRRRGRTCARRRAGSPRAARRGCAARARWRGARAWRRRSGPTLREGDEVVRPPQRWAASIGQTPPSRSV